MEKTYENLIKVLEELEEKKATAEQVNLRFAELGWSRPRLTSKQTGCDPKSS